MLLSLTLMTVLGVVDPVPGAPPPPQPQRTKALVLSLSGLGIDAAIVRNLENYLRTNIATIDGFAVISPVDLQIALSDPKNKSVANCGFGPECALSAGRLVGADVVIFGSISSLGQAFNLNVRAMSIKTGKETARQQTSISGSRDLLIPEVRLTAYKLVAPERIRGWLIVEIDVAGVEIEIDGKSVGTTPLSKPIDNLTPGAHVVVIKRPGYTQFQQEFTIKPFEPTKLRLSLADKK